MKEYQCKLQMFKPVVLVKYMSLISLQARATLSEQTISVVLKSMSLKRA